jgi:hypothetical protein
LLTSPDPFAGHHRDVDRIPPEVLLERVPPDRRATAQALRRLVIRAIPSAVEGVRPGWGLIGYDLPLGRRSAYFAFVWPEVEHVHLGFEYGIYMTDPHAVLQGHGRKLRWVTLRHPNEIDARVHEALVKEAARVAALSKAERLALLLDRDAGPSPASRRSAGSCSI